jgi:hypothetical protein
MLAVYFAFRRTCNTPGACMVSQFPSYSIHFPALSGTTLHSKHGNKYKVLALGVCYNILSW